MQECQKSATSGSRARDTMIAACFRLSRMQKRDCVTEIRAKFSYSSCHRRFIRRIYSRWWEVSINVSSWWIKLVSTTCNRQFIVNHACHFRLVIFVLSFSLLMPSPNIYIISSDSAYIMIEITCTIHSRGDSRLLLSIQ